MIELGQSQLSEMGLGTLSMGAKRLIALAVTDKTFLDELFRQFAQNKTAMWALAEGRVGPLTTQERQLLEMLVELFRPDSSTDLVISNNQAWC